MRTKRVPYLVTSIAASAVMLSSCSTARGPEPHLIEGKGAGYEIRCPACDDEVVKVYRGRSKVYKSRRKIYSYEKNHMCPDCAVQVTMYTENGTPFTRDGATGLVPKRARETPTVAFGIGKERLPTMLAAKQNSPTLKLGEHVEIYGPSGNGASELDGRQLAQAFTLSRNLRCVPPRLRLKLLDAVITAEEHRTAIRG